MTTGPVTVQLTVTSDDGTVVLRTTSIARSVSVAARILRDAAYRLETTPPPPAGQTHG